VRKSEDPQLARKLRKAPNQRPKNQQKQSKAVAWMKGPPIDDWVELDQRLAALKGRLARCRTVNVNTTSVKDAAKQAVQSYFRFCRPKLMQIGVRDEALSDLDSGFQHLLELANGNNPLRRYKAEVSSLLSAKTVID